MIIFGFMGFLGLGAVVHQELKKRRIERRVTEGVTHRMKELMKE